MFHMILFGLITSAIVSRILFRRRLMRYAWASGCGPGFVAFAPPWHVRRHFHGHGGFGGFGGYGPRFRHAFRGGYGPWGFPGPGYGGWDGDPIDEVRPTPDPARLDKALGELDLSDRQREEIDESLTRLRESVGGELGTWRPLPDALTVVAAAEFDRARAEVVAAHTSGALRKEIVDGLEHFHNVLTVEQREKLGRLASA